MPPRPDWTLTEGETYGAGTGVAGPIGGDPPAFTEKDIGQQEIVGSAVEVTEAVVDALSCERDKMV